MPQFTAHDRFNATRQLLDTVRHNLNVFERELPNYNYELEDLHSDLSTLIRRLDRLHHDYANDEIATKDRQMPDSFGADPTMEH